MFMKMNDTPMAETSGASLGAVRSGRLAAEAAAERLGRPIRGLVADLPKNLLVRLLAGS
jgi:hypothetical protein